MVIRYSESKIEKANTLDDPYHFSTAVAKLLHPSRGRCFLSSSVSFAKHTTVHASASL